MLSDIIDRSAELTELRARQAAIQQELEAAQQIFAHELAAMISNRQGLTTLVNIVNGILKEQRLCLSIKRFPRPKQKKTLP